MKLRDRIRREGLISYCENLPFPSLVVDSEYNLLSLNREAQRRFGEVKEGSKCYKVTHKLDRPCWEYRGDFACPVRRLQLGEKPYAYHEHGDNDFHVIVASQLDEDLFMEIYIDSYVAEVIKEFKFLAETDSLTGLYNRRKIEELLQKEIDRSRRYGSPLSLVFLDIDNFKELNDTYGHAKGDEVLSKVACIIKNEVRATDFVGRYGGEEFLIILPHTQPQQALSLAHRIRKRVEEADLGVGKLTVSVGVTGLREKDSIETLFNRVDRAMYMAKERGKNRVELL